jgi:hypothetical protein
MPLFQNDDHGYLNWVAAHPNGFVVNGWHKPTANGMVLHKATCGKARQKNPTSTTYSKYGSETFEDAEMFASALGGSLHHCMICKPQGVAE